MQAVDVLVVGGAAAVVEGVELAVEAEQRTEDAGVEEIDERVEFVDAVFEGSAGENEGVAAAQAFDGLGGLGGPVLDALGLVEHDDVGPEAGVDLQGVGHDLLVVDEREERRVGGGVMGEAGEPAAVDDPLGEGGEAADLFLPFSLERGGGDDEHAAGAAEAVEKGAGGDGLDGLAEAHLVGEERAFGEGEV